jgi:putative aldouronate transport system permease protein
MARGTRFNFVDVVIYAILSGWAIATLYPFINVAAVAMSDYSAYIKNPLLIIPRQIRFDAYKYVFTHPLIMSSYKNTILVTIIGTFLRLFLTATLAYPLSRRGLRGKPFIMVFLIITMMFNGGLIPNFYLIRKLGMYNTLLALIVPASVSAFSVILMKNFFESIPDSLIDAAKIDGASELYILVRVVLPLSTAIIATLSLFFAVGLWNSFFSAVVYIRDRDLWTLQLVLREIVIESGDVLTDELTTADNIQTQNMKYAVIIVAIIPILCLYPFLQRYFVKGIMIGAVKG